LAALATGNTPPSEMEHALTEEDLTTIRQALGELVVGTSGSLTRFANNKETNAVLTACESLDLLHDKGANLLPEDEIIIKIEYAFTVGNAIKSKIQQLITVPFAVAIGEAKQSTVIEETPVFNEPTVGTGPAVGFSNPASQTSAPAGFSGQPNPYAGAAQFQQPQASANRNTNVNAQVPEWTSFNSGPQLNPFETNNLNMLMHIPLKLTVELGRTQKLIKDILDLSQGSIVELDKLAGEAVDILVNDQLIAKGEVVVIDENFGVRVTEIINQWDRLQKLR